MDLNKTKQQDSDASLIMELNNNMPLKEYNLPFLANPMNEELNDSHYFSNDSEVHLPNN